MRCNAYPSQGRIALEQEEILGKKNHQVTMLTPSEARELAEQLIISAHFADMWTFHGEEPPPLERRKER
jgi:hypothetical protein